MPSFPYKSRALTYARGFRAAGGRGGLKTEGPDVALIVADAPCAAAAVYTTNIVSAAPLAITREHLSRGTLRAIAVNSGCANAVTGVEGLEDAREMARMAAEAVCCRTDEVAVASTGVIGHRLPLAKIADGLRAAANRLSADTDAGAALAIMTTDTRPKTVTVDFDLSSGPARLGGICKGSGMIAPNMATMLAFLTTDANVRPDALQPALRHAVRDTFNAVTVDGDTSTNDMVLALASGAAGGDPVREGTEDFATFLRALETACGSLARQVAWDGEGATKLVTVEVLGAETNADARRIARVICESPLTKTALFGNDPNWGRILAAAGRAGAPFDPARANLDVVGIRLLEAGAPVPFDARSARAALAAEEVDIRLSVGDGPGRATMFTCDLSYDYIRINAEYHT